MKRPIAVLTALLLLLSGCGGQMWEYPRAEPPQPVAVEPITLGITVPADADTATQAAVVTLQAKLLELSHDRVTLEVYKAGNVADAMGQDTQGLYLLNAHEVVTLDPRLEFIEMPFLFENAEQMLAMVNSEGGEVRASPVTRGRLGGEVIGVYYGGTQWFLGKTRFYDEVGFYSSVGVLSERAGNSCFGALGAEHVAEGSRAELFALFSTGKIKYCELSPGDEIPEETLAKAKALELTNHRFDSKWLMLRDTDNTLEPAVHSMIKEAFAYTVAQHDASRKEIDTAWQTELELQTGLTASVNEGYENVRMLAKKYYRENWENLRVPPEIWEEIQRVKG